MLYLLRHGQTDANLNRINAGGEWDVPLNAAGRAQARDFAEANEDLLQQFSHIYVSPMVRAQETAVIVMETAGLKLPSETIEDLREWRLGEWSQLSYDDTADFYGQLLTPPDGESFAAFSARVIVALKTLAHRTDEKALVIAHGGVWRCYAHHVNESAIWLENCTPMQLCRVTLQAA